MCSFVSNCSDFIRIFIVLSYISSSFHQPSQKQRQLQQEQKQQQQQPGAAITGHSQSSFASSSSAVVVATTGQGAQGVGSFHFIESHLVSFLFGFPFCVLCQLSASLLSSSSYGIFFSVRLLVLLSTLSVRLFVIFFLFFLFSCSEGAAPGSSKERL